MKKEFEYSGKLMGSTLSMSVIAESKHSSAEAFEKAYDLGYEFEKIFSRFLPNSELSILNRDKELTMSDDFVEAYRIARKLYSNTAGVFNPLISIARFGYDADIESIRETDRPRSLFDEWYDIEYDAVTFNPEQNRITLRDAQQLDFGAFMKGYAAEKMIDVLDSFSGAIVNIGGDIFTRGTDVEGKPFVFAIEDPRDESHVVGFTFTAGAIATSGTTRRQWKIDGKPFTHILDATGMQNPVTDIISATVLSPHGYEADAYATVATILGSVHGSSFLRDHNLDHYLILKDGTHRASAGFTKRLVTT